MGPTLDGMAVTRRLKGHNVWHNIWTEFNGQSYSASVKELLWFAHTILERSQVSEEGHGTIENNQGTPLGGMFSIPSTTMVP